MLSDIAELAARMRQDSARHAQEQRKLERRLSSCEEKLSAQRFQHWRLESEARREIARLRVLEERVATARGKLDQFAGRCGRAASV